MYKKMKQLSDPFPYEDIEWRVQQSGISKKNEPWAMVLAYVTNRAIMSRLDEVFGAFGWRNEYKEAPQGGVLCGISVRNPVLEEWVTKWDGADNTDIEAIKGGLSNAMKRAAVQWGIGRYLYRLDAAFINVLDDMYAGEFRVKIKDRKYSWNPPALPKWALPAGYDPALSKAPKPKKKVTKAKVPSKEVEVLGVKYSTADLIMGIEKLGKELTPPNWKHFKESRFKQFKVENLLELKNGELIAFGRELKKWVNESKGFDKQAGVV